MRAGGQCLSEAQLSALRTHQSSYRFSFALANGITEYPGWGLSGEATRAYGPTGGWSSCLLYTSPSPRDS